MKKLVIIFTVILLSVGNLYAQHKIIKGRVITEDLEPVPQAPIMMNDSVEIGKTDANGFFQVEIPLYVNKLTFTFVGIEQANILLAENCEEAEVIMMMRGTYDFMTLRKVDRLRLKRFNKLPELHRDAFAKGIFKTDKPCYTQEFVPNYKKKQK
ncbi:MAG: hypothetical protein QM802_02910 [Agriterribacter sp.]